MAWEWSAAALMTLTALTHSALGETRLIRPILAIDHRLLARPLARQIIRFAWHLTSALMLLCAIAVVWPGAPGKLVALIGGVWLAAGLIDLAVTRGRHVGWPMLALAGLCAIIGGLR